MENARRVYRQIHFAQTHLDRRSAEKDIRMIYIKIHNSQV